MAENYAVRSLRLCTKDCLCLYVCPTGATDTENSIIDVNKCIGCGKCAASCPSGAITMMPKKLPPQQKKDSSVVNALKTIIRSKIMQEQIAANLPNELAEAIHKSNRLMSEDLVREAGFMLPQSANTFDFLNTLKKTKYAPVDEIDKLLDNIQFNEKKEPQKMEKWKCTVCGYIHEGAMSEDFRCPICNQPASKFVKIE